MIENYSTTCIAVQTDTTPSVLCVSQRTYTDGHLLPKVQHNNMCTNDLSHLVNASFYVYTREQSYKKIGAYTSLESYKFTTNLKKLAQLTELRQFSNTILKNEE